MKHMVSWIVTVTFVLVLASIWILLRWEVVASSAGPAYKLDRWTGQMFAVSLSEEKKIKKWEESYAEKMLREFLK